MEKLIIAIVTGVCSVAFSLFLAQVVLFGLSYYHIQSGLVPVWFFIVVAEAVVASGVGTGIRGSK